MGHYIEHHQAVCNVMAFDPQSKTYHYLLIQLESLTRAKIKCALCIMQFSLCTMFIRHIDMCGEHTCRCFMYISYDLFS